MWLVFGCAFLAVVQSAIGDAGASFTVAIAALVSAFLTELLMTSTVHGLKKIKDGSAAASALVLTLLLPNYIHPVYAAMGAAFAMVVVKHSFGGLGSNWMNPALGGWLFIRFSWPQAFAAALDGAADRLPQAGGAADQVITGFFNKFIFLFFGAELPAGYIDLFSLQSPGIIADRAVLALVIAVAVIAACEISRSWLSVLYLAVFGFLIRMAGDPDGAWWSGDVLLAFLSGGTLVAAFILIVDPSSGAKSMPGNIIIVILAAVLSMVFRVFASAFYGCFFAVALANAFTPFLCKLERRLLYPMNPAGGIVFKGDVVFKESAVSTENAVLKNIAVSKDSAAPRGGVR
jgi:electron transport complex protein RnfD